MTTASHVCICELEAKCPEDAAYLAECEARRKTGSTAARARSVTRVPTEYQTQRLWRIEVDVFD